MTPSPRMAVAAAAISAALVVGMAGTAIAFEDVDCSDFACESLPSRLVTTTPPPAEVDSTSAPVPERPLDLTPPTIGPAEAVPAAVAEAADLATTPQAVTVEAPPVDRDCPDFASQADAQVALQSSPGDPEQIDADNDGIACEDRFGTEGRQVAVVPLGGVATGGTRAS